MEYAYSIYMWICRYVWDKGKYVESLHCLFLFSQGGFISLTVRFSWTGPASAPTCTEVVAQRISKVPIRSTSAVVNTGT